MGEQGLAKINPQPPRHILLADPPSRQPNHEYLALSHPPTALFSHYHTIHNHLVTSPQLPYPKVPFPPYHMRRGGGDANETRRAAIARCIIPFFPCTPPSLSAPCVYIHTHIHTYIYIQVQVQDSITPRRNPSASPKPLVPLNP